MKRALVSVSLVSLFAGCPGVNPITDGDAGSDAGTTMTMMGTDAGSDAGVEDAGFDAGVIDAGIDAGVDAGYVKDPLITARPFNEVVPVSYVAGTPTPLVVLLHGYTATAATQDAYFRLTQLAQTRGFLLALPDGTVDNGGRHFWNATDACCGFGAMVDDVTYLTAVINDMRARYSVDPKRIWLAGHSNGGFMAHRMACDRSELIAGIMALAGDVWNDASMCVPTTPVNVLQVHGTLDAVIAYNGGMNVGNTYPSAVTSVTTWATKNGCTGTSLTRIGGDLDLDLGLFGSETERYQFTGCPAGGAVEHWKIVGGSHIPSFGTDWADTFYTWLVAHPKP